jgi:hypothetical protein
MFLWSFGNFSPFWYVVPKKSGNPAFFQRIALLSRAYKHVEDVDLFMGGVMENWCPGKVQQGPIL